MIPKGVMRSLGLLCVGAILSGCPTSSSESTDAKVYDYTKATVSDRKALIYNLIGRWYPTKEIARLDNDAMTPEEWCAREPARIEIFLDDVSVYCENGDRYEAPIARVDRAEEGGILLVLRAPEDSKLKQLHFKTVVSKERVPNQPRALLFGSPCAPPSEGVDYARFWKLEILERQILGGRHCAQVRK